MPKLSWNEIRQNAIQFSREWQDARDVRAEAQTFWNEFFEVFGVRRRTVAVFEDPVKSLRDTHHRIDLFWKGTFLAEHKSAGESLDKAHSQAFQYIQELYSAGRQDEVPRWVCLSDFQRFALYDLEPEEQLELPLWRDHKYQLTEFTLADLHKQVKLFAFVIGQKTHRFGEEDPANIQAAEIMAKLHDAVESSGYQGEKLERLLVRLLFCLFADDTGIFERTQFEQFLDNHTRADGTDPGARLSHLFEVLNTPVEKRVNILEEDIAAFPYINGELFAEHLHIASFNRDMRNSLCAACRFDWSRISPAVFGSLFQNIMDDTERRQIGAHYTTERNILKVIRPLFLDALRAEFGLIKNDRSARRKARLREFHDKLARLTFLDPACGCGNFLVIAYRELRRLELEVLTLLHEFEKRGKELNLGELAKLSRIDVNQFYGIEIGDWAARIAETALWLTDHQMNMELTNSAGNLFQRIPLRTAPHIRCANALRMDWNDLIPALKCAFILGNPPFVGKHLMNLDQKRDAARIWGSEAGAGSLDYVTCWYRKAADFTKGNSTIAIAFVSTNSICQGEQAGYLWNYLFQSGMHIHFAHQTFAWQSEARGRAHVHVVIIGFGRLEPEAKHIYEYTKPDAEPHSVPVRNISPYLVEGPDLAVSPRSQPLCDVPKTMYGNKPTDGGHLIIEVEERVWLKRNHPELLKYVLPLVCAEEYLQGKERYCLWLQYADVSAIRKHEYLAKRLAAVKAFRLASKKAPTRELASIPYLFAEIRQPETSFLVIPQHSSENRRYIPFGYFQPTTIIHNSCTAIPDATDFHFGVLSSGMHMVWMRQVCGRLESRYRYSAKLVYNNFPWPLDASPAQHQRVEERAEAVLSTRQRYLDMGQTLTDLYDPFYMPEPLLKAHLALDRAVDKCYRRAEFMSERERVEYLFALYEQLVSPLAQSIPIKKVRRRSPK
ncbi:MAG: DNA methyltransferase [Candidatus Hydrogenedentes bacterium]|nr:DNA methyltransferase [Candidatus Hydrogenedentota bacterium]